MGSYQSHVWTLGENTHGQLGYRATGHAEGKIETPVERHPYHKRASAVRVNGANLSSSSSLPGASSSHASAISSKSALLSLSSTSTSSFPSMSSASSPSAAVAAASCGANVEENSSTDISSAASAATGSDDNQWNRAAHIDAQDNQTLRDLPRPCQLDAAHGLRVRQVCAGTNHSAIVLENGSILTWGANESGQLGHRLAPDSFLLKVDRRSAVTSRSLWSGSRMRGSDERSDSSPTAANTNFERALRAVAPSSTTNTDIKSPRKSEASEQSLNTASMVKSAERLAQTRASASSQLSLSSSNATSVSTPKPVYIPSRNKISFASVSCGTAHTVALTSTGDCYTWGCDRNGRLGRATASSLAACTPGRVSGLGHVHSASCGAFHTAVRTISGKCFAWGQGTSGRLGMGDQRDRFTPAPVSGIEHLFVIEVVCGGHHTLILGSPRHRHAPNCPKRRGPEDQDVHNGTTLVYSCGGGSFGKLGHGGTRAELAPRLIESLQSRSLVEDGNFHLDFVVCIAAGSQHSAAVTKRGALLTWGQGSQGKLGLGSHDNQLSPKRVSGLESSVCYVSCGAQHTCTISEDGDVHAFGQAHLLCGGELIRQQHRQKLRETAGESTRNIATLRPFSSTDSIGSSNSVSFPSRMTYFCEKHALYVTEISCGGAHTIFLTRSKSDKTAVLTKLVKARALFDQRGRLRDGILYAEEEDSSNFNLENLKTDSKTHTAESLGTQNALEDEIKSKTPNKQEGKPFAGQFEGRIPSPFMKAMISFNTLPFPSLQPVTAVGGTNRRSRREITSLMESSGGKRQLQEYGTQNYSVITPSRSLVDLKRAPRFSSDNLNAPSSVPAAAASNSNFAMTSKTRPSPISSALSNATAYDAESHQGLLISSMSQQLKFLQEENAMQRRRLALSERERENLQCIVAQHQQASHVSEHQVEQALQHLDSVSQGLRSQAIKVFLKQMRGVVSGLRKHLVDAQTEMKAVKAKNAVLQACLERALRSKADVMDLNHQTSSTGDAELNQRSSTKGREASPIYNSESEPVQESKSRSIISSGTFESPNEKNNSIEEVNTLDGTDDTVDNK